MPSRLQRSREIVRNKGIFSLIEKATSYLYSEIKWKLSTIHGRYRLQTTEGVAYYNPSKSEGSIKSRYRLEVDELDDFTTELKSEDVVLDVGANTGLYSCFAASKCGNGHIIAVEPYPPNVPILEENLQMNGDNWDVYSVALADLDGTTIEFNVPPEDRVGYGQGAISDENSEKTITVESLNGDSLLEREDIPQPSVVKIDVEGTEPLVLDGLSATLSHESCRVVYCEIHFVNDTDRPSIKDFNTTEEGIRELLKSHGFSVKTISERGTEIMLKGKKK